MAAASDFVARLREFNSKERFYVVGTALGNPRFRLSKQFRAQLNEAFGVRVPASAFAAMDYHLDWLYAAVFLAANGKQDGVFKMPKQITATQQDIDLLVAYPDDGTCHVIMVEAKGVGSFSNRQLDSKRRRLQSIFGKGAGKWEGVRPYFGVMSPKEPAQRLALKGWPTWLRPNGKLPWIEMKLPEGLKAVTRSDNGGRSKRDGGYWTVVKRKATRED